jgi:hypothetical protein
VVATTAQCYIYTTKNWNTPIIIDLKESPDCSFKLMRDSNFISESLQRLYSQFQSSISSVGAGQ